MCSRTAKIAIVAALAGMMLAVGLVALTSEPSASPEMVNAEPRKSSDFLDRELERCATLTMPDDGCEQAWAEKRRRFFGRDEGDRP